MENTKSEFETLFEKLEDYGNTNIKLFRYKTIEKTAEATSSFTSKVWITLPFLFAAFIFSIGCALWLGEVLGKVYYGFIAVSGVYIIVGVVLLLNKDKIKQRMGDRFIKQLFNN